MYKKVMLEKISNIRVGFLYFVTNLASKYSVLMNKQDKKHLPKMHTQVVTMN